ncbi:type IV secretion system DNA-binding domain-containing protein [Escherichia coli]
MGTKEDPFWQGSGRTIFAEAAYLMRNYPTAATANWWTHCFPSKSKNCVPSCVIHQANLVEEKIEKTAISIRAVLTNYVKAIRYLQGIEA